MGNSLCRMARRLLAPFLPLLVIGGCATAPSPENSAPRASDDAESMQPVQPGRTFAFDCDGLAFTIRTGPGELALYLPDRYVVLSQVRAASGTKFQDHDIVFWNKGEDASLEVGARRYDGCKVDHARSVTEDARLRGARFRGVGNEPGWLLEIGARQWIRFTGDYGNTTVSAPLPVPAVEDGRTVYRTRTTAHVLEAIVEREVCFDTMSGAQFEATVTVRMDGREYRGCGRWFE
ncbi:MliC family protein [Noviherbaspirillum cavernae]|nr:MliC family protein [Noviherbaspirillum cavernae]